MALQCLRSPVLYPETRRREFNSTCILDRRGAQLLGGFVPEPISHYDPQRSGCAEFRNYSRRVLALAGHQHSGGRMNYQNSWSLSRVFTAKFSSATHRVLKPVLASRHWQTRVFEGNGGARTESVCDQSETQDWEVRWELNTGNLKQEKDSSVGSKNGASRTSLERELEVAVRAVQLASLLSQRTQRKVISKEETADEKKDRSLVTVAGEFIPSQEELLSVKLSNFSSFLFNIWWCR
jgi:hypothetical protein